MQEKILNTKLKKFIPESHDITISGNGPCQKELDSIYIAISYAIKIAFWDSPYYRVSRHKFHTISRRPER